MRNDYDQRLLELASESLDAACRLLDKHFGVRQWRLEWTIADTANEVRREAFGYGRFEAAEEEALLRGDGWSARFDAAGRAMVVQDE